MNKKGFTIVEILVAVIILGIIAAIAIPVYNNINNSAKQKNYDNKIKQIELAAEKWADENNLSRPITIPILQLVQQGALSADEGTTDSVIEPVNNTDIKCHSINITFENYVPQAEYIDKEINNCQAKLEEENDPNIILTAYQVGRSDNSNQGELVYQTNTKELAWTKNNVQVLINIDDSTIYNFTDDSKITFSGSGINQTRSLAEGYTICSNYQTDISKCANAVSITGNNLIATIYATIETTEGLKSKEVTVKIDNLAPTLNATVDNEEEWVNHDRTITIEATDGNVGSGIQFVTENTIPIDNFSGSATIQRDEGTYTMVAIDKAGNESEEIILIIDNVDKVAPSVGYSKDNNWINTNRTLKVSGIDSQSGVAGYFVSQNNKETLEENKLTSISTPYTLLDNGTYYVYLADNAGNLSEPLKVEEKYIDKVDPSMSMRNGAVYHDSFSAVGAVGDSYGELDKLKIYLDNVLKYDIDSPLGGNQIYNFDNLVPLTYYDVKIVLTDKAGNETTTSFDIRTAQPPETTFELNQSFSIVRKKGTCVSTTSTYAIASGNLFTTIVSIDYYLKSYENHHTGLKGDSYFKYRLDGDKIIFEVCASSDASLVSATYHVNSITLK